MGGFSIADDSFLRLSRLHGPELTCVMKSAAPGMDTFFMNIAICIWRIMGSATVQKLCSMGLTAISNRAMSDEPRASPGAIAGSRVRLREQ